MDTLYDPPHSWEHAEPTDLPADFTSTPDWSPAMLDTPAPAPIVATLRRQIAAVVDAAAPLRPWRERLTLYPRGYSYSMELRELHTLLRDMQAEGNDVDVKIIGDRWIIRTRVAEQGPAPVDLDTQREGDGWDDDAAQADAAHTRAEVQAA